MDVPEGPKAEVGLAKAHTWNPSFDASVNPFYGSTRRKDRDEKLYHDLVQLITF